MAGEAGRSVWIVNHYAGHPRLSTAGSRHHSLALGLVARGWDVTIFAADTAHPSGRRFTTTQSIEFVDGVRYRWIRTPPYGRGGTPARLANMLAFSLSLLLPSAIRGLPRPDVVLGSTVHPFAAWSAARLGRRLQVPFVFEIRDLWPETLIQIGNLSRNHPLVRVFASIERSLVGQAVTIITTMPLAHVYLARLGVPKSKVVWISNGADIERFQVTSPPEREHLELLYFGSLGTANGMDAIIDGFALAAARTADLKLVIVGDGPERMNLERRAAELGLEAQIRFVGAVPRAQIPALAVEADAFIACTLPLPLYEFGISLNKLFEYLAGARPILYGGAEIGNPLAEAEGVFVVPPNAAAVAEAIVSMSKSNQASRWRWGLKNREFASANFSYQVLAGRLQNVLVEAINIQNV